MNELSRHIEILLLDNDCVIVPGLGGFMAHYRHAELDKETGTFYPPQRTLGFNSQLRINDSLLTQSYVETYDISYPEATKRIEAEVAEIKQTITIEGAFEFHGIGTLTHNAEGVYHFEPCIAGLLTPTLYSLNSFSFCELTRQQTESVTLKIEETHKEIDTTVNVNLQEEPGNNYITLYTLRNLMAAAMILLLFVFSSIPAGIGSNKIIACSLLDTELIASFIKQSTLIGGIITDSCTIKNMSLTDTVTTADTNALKTNTASKITQNDAETVYSIVLASMVTRNGAKTFIEKLNDNGFKEAHIDESGKVRKVTYGYYTTKEEAQIAMTQLKEKNATFAEAWILKVNHSNKR